MYNRLLQLALPDGVELLAFADGVAVISTAAHSNFLPEKLEPAFDIMK